LTNIKKNVINAKTNLKIIMIKYIDFFHKKINFIFFLLIIIITIILFFPALNNNSVPGYNDILLYSNWRVHIRQAFLNKEFPLWFPHQMGGIPSLVSYNPSLLYPFTFLLFFVDNIFFTNLLYIIHFLLIPLFMYFFLCFNKFEKNIAAICSMIWAFSGYILVRFWVGHSDYIIAFTYVPLILLFYQKLILFDKPIFIWLTAFFAGLQFFAGSPEYVVYTHILIFLYFLYYLFTLKKFKIFTFKTCFFYFLFLLFIFIQLYPLLEYTKYSIRGNSFKFATMISFPLKNLITFILPYFFGDHLHFNFWGEQNFFEQYCYVGILPLFAFFILLITKTKPIKYLYFFIIFSGIFLALGKNNPFYSIIIKVIFPLSKLRAPARAMFFTLFGFTMLTAYFLKYIYNSEISLDSKRLKNFLKIIFIFSIILFIIYLIPTTLIFNQIKNPTFLNKIKLPYITFRWKLWHLAILLFLYSLAFLKIKNKNILFCVLFFLTFYETIIFNNRYIDYNGHKINFSDDLIIQQLKNDNDFFRVLTNEHITSNSKYNIHNIHTMLAFTPTYLKNVCDFIAIGIDNRKNYIEDTYKTWFSIAYLNNYNSPLVDLFNVKYFIDYNINENNNYKKIFNNFYLKQNYFPRFKFFYNSIYENSFSKTLELLNNKDFDYKNILIINNDEKIQLNNLTNTKEENQIIEIKYNYNSIELKVKINQEAILFTGEIYYPGWKVYVDGKERKILITNNIFRAIKCEKGDEKILFIFKPFYLKCGLISLSLFFLIGFALILKQN